MSKEGIERAYKPAYLIALQFTTLEMIRVYDFSCNYSIPKYMLTGSFKRAKYAEMRINNDFSDEDFISGRIALRNNIFK
jgi:hypothetical protein